MLPFPTVTTTCVHTQQHYITAPLAIVREGEAKQQCAYFCIVVIFLLRRTREDAAGQYHVAVR